MKLSSELLQFMEQSGLVIEERQRQWYWWLRDTRKRRGGDTGQQSPAGPFASAGEALADALPVLVMMGIDLAKVEDPFELGPIIDETVWTLNEDRAEPIWNGFGIDQLVQVKHIGGTWRVMAWHRKHFRLLVQHVEHAQRVIEVEVVACTPLKQIAFDALSA